MPLGARLQLLGAMPAVEVGVTALSYCSTCGGARIVVPLRNPPAPEPPVLRRAVSSAWAHAGPRGNRPMARTFHLPGGLAERAAEMQ